MKTVLRSIILSLILLSCGSSAIISTPIENIDRVPLKISELSEKEAKKWGHLDLLSDTIPGMSIEKAYENIIKNKKGRSVIVGVIDSGIDINHEDLDDVIWVNADEIPGNNIDDDGNGYIDDVHGWNFLGDGYNEQLEYVRLLASGKSDHPLYEDAKAEYQKEFQKYSNLKNQYGQIDQRLQAADGAIMNHLQKENYNNKDLDSINTSDQALMDHVGFMRFILSNGFDDSQAAKTAIENDMNQINDFLDYYLNKSYNGRVVGDDPGDFSQNKYGNGNVAPIKKKESHGTHVAGIIAAERNNGMGVNGVANNVKIMALRTVPNGDEYDKDVALAIRYAADNGAKVVNMSFGKYYSPHSEWVYDAIVYAASKDVLLVAGAGNESLDLDSKNNFPNDALNNGEEVADNFLSVGALDPKYGPDMIADYSNFGKINVDLFAPGSEIYSTVPENTYEAMGGTSMAAPAVSGIAALIRSFYPDLTASQVKRILMDSGISTNIKVVVGGDTNNIKEFKELSRSGKMINAYNALIMAAKMSKYKIP